MISIGNLKAADISDPGLLSEMEAAMKPEYIILFPDALEVAFPQGTLPSQEYSYVAVSYTHLGCMECGPAEGLSMRFYMWEGKNDCIFRDKMIWYRE